MATTKDSERIAPRVRHGLWIVVLVPALVAALAFANTLGHGFVYDDPIILKWLETRSWDVESFLSDTRGVTYAVHAFDRYLWGDWAGGYHLTNLVLHVVCVALATLAMALLSGSHRIALLGGLAFALHPVHVEVVANVSNRKDMLAMIFAMAALMIWARPGRTWPRIELTIVLYALGLYSKEVAIAMLPVMLALADVLLGSEPPGSKRLRLRRALLHMSPLLVIGVVATLVFAGDVGRFFTSEWIAGKTDGAYDSYTAALATGLGNVGEIARLLVFPVHLSIDYPIVPETSFTSPRVLLGAALVAIWLAGAVVVSKRVPLVGFAMLWTLVMYLPCSNIVPLHHILVAERYLYVPSFGFCLAAAWLADRALGALGAREHAAATRLGYAALAILLVALGVRTALRNRDWRDWPALIAAGDRDGVDTWRLHKSAGAWAIGTEDYDEAAWRYRRAAELRPRDPELHFWQAVALQRDDRLDEAVVEYGKTLQLQPDNAKAHYNIGVAALRKNDLSQAIARLRSTIELDPEYAPAHLNLGMALVLLERYELAIMPLREAVRLAPNSYPEAYLNLGAALERTGDLAGALDAYRDAARCDPDNPAALEERADAALALGHLEEALFNYRELLGVRPGSIGVLEKIGAAYETAGEWMSAIGTYQAALELERSPRVGARLASALDAAVAPLLEAVTLDPEHGEAYLNLATVFRLRGNSQRALVASREAARFSPSDPRAHEALGDDAMVMKSYREAADAYRHLCALREGDAAAFAKLGGAHEALGERVSAIECYRAALALPPADDDELRAELDRRRQALGDG